MDYFFLLNTKNVKTVNLLETLGPSHEVGASDLLLGSLKSINNTRAFKTFKIYSTKFVVIDISFTFLIIFSIFNVQNIQFPWLIVEFQWWLARSCQLVLSPDLSGYLSYGRGQITWPAKISKSAGSKQPMQSRNLRICPVSFVRTTI